MATERQPYPGNPDDTIDSVMLTGDGVAVAAPCLLWGVIARGTGAAAAAVTIHDGRNTTGRIWGRVGVSTATVTAVAILPKPRYFEQGVFLDFSSGDMADVVVLYELLSPYREPR